MNSNVMKDASVRAPYSFGHSEGIKFGFNVNEKIGFTVDVLNNVINQRYKSDIDSMNWEKKVKLNYIDIPVLFRSFNELTYFEIGPQISFLVKYKEEHITPLTPVLTYEQKYQPYNIFAVIGLGTPAYTNKKLAIIVTFRFAYGLLDITQEDENNKDYPYSTFPNYAANAELKPYKATHTVMGGIGAEINFSNY